MKELKENVAFQPGQELVLLFLQSMKKLLIYFLITIRKSTAIVMFKLSSRNLIRSLSKQDLAQLSSRHWVRLCLNLLLIINLGKQLSKFEQISNWSLRPLRRTQLHYGAMDAYILVKLYEEFSGVFEKNVSFPQV